MLCSGRLRCRPNLAQGVLVCTPPPPYSLYQEQGRLFVRCIFDLKHLPIRGVLFWRSSHQSGGDPLCHEGGESGVDHNDFSSVVISLFGMP